MEPTWLLMFYSLPTKPERNRLRIYRRLQKEGTLSLNGVHLLPYNEDRYEFFQWLYQEIKTLDGEMNFVTIEKIEMMDNSEVISLFQKQSEASYTEIDERIKALTTELLGFEHELDSEQEHIFRQTLKKITRDFDPLYAIDFFHSSKGKTLSNAIKNVQTKLESLLESKSSSDLIVPLHNIADYQSKKWQTRPRPFVDRMASAWLIQKCIDPHAEFIFSNSINDSDSKIITYDMNNANFTHIGDLCTFEVLLQSFAIQDNAMEEIAKIIHNLDLNDDKYITPEAEGIKLILTSIRNSTANDQTILLKSYEIFDYLYLSRFKY